MAETAPIPEPRGYPYIGNIAEFTGLPMRDMTRLADIHGPIYRLWIGSQSMVVVSNNKFVNEICDERRFKKTLKSVLKRVREGAHDGLFTADDAEPNWGKAHRILTPAFGPLPIRGTFDEMHDIASQLAMKFARHGPDTPILTSDEFTRPALDTLALCSMDFRFNSFYRDEMHPFIKAMGGFLYEGGIRDQRPGFAPEWLFRKRNEKDFADIAILEKTAMEVVELRKQNPSQRKDLLQAMLSGTDSQTGEKLSDENVANQLITFLIAGHETTFGLLCFAFYHLLNIPEEYRKVQEEVDAVCGREPITVDKVSKLPYVAAVLREALRCDSTIPAFGVEPFEDTLVGGRYPIRAGEPIIAILPKAHRDPEVFGDDANDFKPERMLDEPFGKLQEDYPNCWKAFGNGKRSCIGRPFAWQEALLAMAMLFQNFNFVADDPNYQLDIVETLTLKPGGYRIRAKLRHGMTPTELEYRLAGRRVEADGEAARKKKSAAAAAAMSGAAQGRPISVHYGSNSGTCEAMAQRVAADAPLHGFRASTVAPLDAAHQNMPKDQPIVIVTASYEGQPPSNAGLFVSWMESLKSQEMEDVNYAVYGCGHHDWSTTFHRIPKLVDTTLTKLGGHRLIPMGSTDAADRDMFSDFETWEDEKLWPALREKYGASEVEDAIPSGISVQVSTPRKPTLRQDLSEAIVLSERLLTSPGAAAPKKHIEIQLPTGMTYSSGDYLAILPQNPKETVARVFRRFGLSWDASLKIDAEGPTTLPTGGEVSAVDVLGAYVELSQPATKRNIGALLDVATEKEVVEELQRLSGDGYSELVMVKRVPVLELLERFPSLGLPFGTYLSVLPPMRVR